MIDQLLHNGLCWAIVLLALVSYYSLWMALFQRGGAVKQADIQFEHTEQSSSIYLQQEFSAALINALPLMGLLGTIIGLLTCFAGIASNGASSETVSGGIAEALLTTQLGLVCAVPGWLLLAYVRASRDKRAPLAEGV